MVNVTKRRWYCCGFIEARCIWIAYVTLDVTGGYDGVKPWREISTTCGDGTRQSPIDIPYADSGQMSYSADLGSFIFSGFDSIPTDGFKISNNEHSVVVTPSANISRMTIEGGGLNGTYVAAQFHFHWGRNNTEGSEHLFRGRQYPMELHIVHYKQEYGTISESLGHSDGLAVLGFFFVVSKQENSRLTAVISALDNIKYKDQSETILINMIDVIPEHLEEYYRYEGSLTTPTCDEAVVWTLFENKNYISSTQLAKFRQLYKSAKGDIDEHKMSFNYRPKQKLFGRTIYKNYMDDVPQSFHWSYEGHEGPGYWQNYFSDCKGHSQSPVDIPGIVDNTLVYDPTLELDTLTFTYYDQTVKGQIKNNGHTIQVDVETAMYIEHGGLQGRYRAAQFHFHWGENDTHGSEHTRDGKAYPLELHIVHYKEEYGSLTDAVNRDDGLAVVGFLFEVQKNINMGYSKFITKLRDVKFKGLAKDVGDFTMENITYRSLSKALQNAIHMPYVRYIGSLTTPPCSQVVTWSIMMTPIGIQAEQLAEFRKITHVYEEDARYPANEHDLIKRNYRPTQALNTRRVFISYDVSISARHVSNLDQCAAAVIAVYLLVRLV